MDAAEHYDEADAVECPFLDCEVEFFHPMLICARHRCERLSAAADLPTGGLRPQGEAGPDRRPADCGYVIAWPSRRSDGGAYRRIGKTRPAPAPPALIERLWPRSHLAYFTKTRYVVLRFTPSAADNAAGLAMAGGGPKGKDRDGSCPSPIEPLRVFSAATTGNPRTKRRRIQLGYVTGARKSVSADSRHKRLIIL